jgi:hypothetical protein
MHVWHMCWPWSFEQENGALRLSRKRGCLREQSAVCERDREIGVGLTLDEHAVVDQVIAGGQALHMNVKIAAAKSKSEERRIPFGDVDTELVARRLHRAAAGDVSFDRRAARVRSVACSNQAWLEGKPKVPGQVNTPFTTNHQR